MNLNEAIQIVGHIPYKLIVGINDKENEAINIVVDYVAKIKDREEEQNKKVDNAIEKISKIYNDCYKAIQENKTLHEKQDSLLRLSAFCDKYNYQQLAKAYVKLIKAINNDEGEYNEELEDEDENEDI